jgi:DNA repair photolyase
MAKTHYIEIPCRTALNRVRGMPFAWSLNPYRGCTHNCHYCYAVATHAYYGLAAKDFGSTIFVKTNLVEVLRGELARRSWANEKVAIGTATDPYQPCEGRYRLTRGALEALRERTNPFSIVTKSTLVLRDLDVLVDLSRQTDVTVHFTITTLDPATWRSVEPGTPPPWKRLQVMRRLVEAGVSCGVFLAPILPGITDSAESIEAVVESARKHGASHVWASPLRLAPLVKEHYLGFVADVYPDLVPRYERAYSGTNAPANYQTAIQARLDRILARHGYDQDSMREGRSAPARATRTDPEGPLQLSLRVG